MRCSCQQTNDYGPCPYITNVNQLGIENRNYREAIWTGEYLQMTSMCIPPCGDIGLEVHCDTDQLIRVECGRAVVKMGDCKECLEKQRMIQKGDVVFVPAGTWHNVVNTEQTPLKLSTVYAPPHHPHGTVHSTKMDAQREEY